PRKPARCTPSGRHARRAWEGCRAARLCQPPGVATPLAGALPDGASLVLASRFTFHVSRRLLLPSITLVLPSAAKANVRPARSLRSRGCIWGSGIGAGGRPDPRPPTPDPCDRREPAL